MGNNLMAVPFAVAFLFGTQLCAPGAAPSQRAVPGFSQDVAARWRCWRGTSPRRHPELASPPGGASRPQVVKLLGACATRTLISHMLSAVPPC